MNPESIDWSQYPKVQPMSLAELKAAIVKAKKVVVYVPVADFFLEVEVAKTKLLKALEQRLEDWQDDPPAEYVAEWLEDDVLLVGGERDYDDEEDVEQGSLRLVGAGVACYLAGREKKEKRA